jgi:predicted Rossmann fold flavoprotein
MKRIAIIGGGASGLMAACFACGMGREVVLFEKQKKPGRKILVTGNGRCNISNRAIDASRYHGLNPSFVNNVFARFGPEETEAFFLSLGVPFVEGREGKLFPASLQASSVVAALEYEAARRGADIRLHRRIDSARAAAAGFVVATAGREEHACDAVILAAGSCAYPAAGASKIGYELAASMKHRIVDCFPAILPLNIVEKDIRKLQGIKWDCGVAVTEGNKTVARSRGELLFTAFGISGPAALDVSRAVNERVLRGEAPAVALDLYPDREEGELLALLESLWQDGGRALNFSLGGVMKERMPGLVCARAGLGPERKVATLSAAEKKKLAFVMKNLKLTPGAPRDYVEAVVTAGGVDVREINAATMESKLVKGLYITGELLDIDGDSGGFNLQFAWSTGALAGMAQ